jgi:KUP system potassium uptake protein
VGAWLSTLAIIGIVNISNSDSRILRAYNPEHAISFIIRRGVNVLSGILLSITGVEAIFTNLSHYNRHSVQWTFTLIVYPCLSLTYLGQAAALLRHPEWIENSFYNCIPGGIGSVGYWIVLILATLATVVASQAVIVGIFSIVYVSTPRSNVDHSSSSYGLLSLHQDGQNRP